MPKIDHRVSLTDRKLKALKRAKKGARYQVMDVEIPGFGIRVTDTGIRTFILRTRYAGAADASRRELGKYPAMTLADAREKARRWTIQIKQGIDPSLVEEKQATENQLRQKNTFAAVAEEWFVDKVRGERKGREVERDFRSQFVSPLGKRPIDEVTEAEILSIIKTKKRTAPSQARNLLSDVKRFFVWVVDERSYGLKVSPCAQIKATRVIGKKVKGKRILSEDELFALWRPAFRMPYPHGPAYRLLMLSALRLNEAVDASKTEFVWRENIWIIPPQRMKGKDGDARAHIVPITGAIKDLIKGLPQFKQGPYLFSTTFGRSPAWLSTLAKRRVDKRMLLTLRALARQRGEDPSSVTLQPWVNHDIRRTVRSQLSRLRVTEEAREAVLAHARPGIAGTYDHYDYLDEKREALELWAARLHEIVTPKTGNVIKFRATA